MKGKYKDDIALLNLKRKITFMRNNAIAPICLPTNKYDYFGGAEATAVGWGVVKYSN